MDYLKSEHLKFKRTISNKLIFIVPLITAIFAWLMGGYIGYQYMTLYWWYAFLLPGEYWFYTDVYEIYGTDKAEAVAVNVNDNYYIAKRQ